MPTKPEPKGGKPPKRKPYRKPSISSSEAFYTRALACHKGFIDGQPDPGCLPNPDPSFS
jgi:hypothetical protein